MDIYVIKGYPLKNRFQRRLAKFMLYVFFIFTIIKTKYKFIVISNEFQVVFTVSSLVGNPVL